MCALPRNVPYLLPRVISSYEKQKRADESAVALLSRERKKFKPPFSRDGPTRGTFDVCSALIKFRSFPYLTWVVWSVTCCS